MVISFTPKKIELFLILLSAPMFSVASESQKSIIEATYQPQFSIAGSSHQLSK
eukprot:UN10220